MVFFLVFYTDQKPLDLAQGAEMKHVLVGNKVCGNGLHLYNVEKIFEFLKYIDAFLMKTCFSDRPSTKH